MLGSELNFVFLGGSFINDVPTLGNVCQFYIIQNKNFVWCLKKLFFGKYHLRTTPYPVPTCSYFVSHFTGSIITTFLLPFFFSKVSSHFPCSSWTTHKKYLLHETRENFIFSYFSQKIFF